MDYNMDHMIWCISYKLYDMNYMICKTGQTDLNNFKPFHTVSTYYSELRQTSVLNMLLSSVLKKYW